MVQRNPPLSVWHHLVLSWCTMVSEVKRRDMQEGKNIDYSKQHHTPHCWLPAKVMYPANSTNRFYWLTRSTSILLMKNVQVYICYIYYIYIYILHIYIYILHMYVYIMQKLNTHKRGLNRDFCLLSNYTFFNKSYRISPLITTCRYSCFHGKSLF